jgi:hypothetical protein
VSRCCSDTATSAWTSYDHDHDHDLGDEDTIWPVVEVLERAAFEQRPLGIGVIYVHSANPAGAAIILQVLQHWRYGVRSAAGSPHVGYLDDLNGTDEAPKP